MWDITKVVFWEKIIALYAYRKEKGLAINELCVNSVVRKEYSAHKESEKEIINRNE